MDGQPKRAAFLSCAECSKTFVIAEGEPLRCPSCNSPHLKAITDRERKEMAFWFDELFPAPDTNPRKVQ